MTVLMFGSGALISSKLFPVGLCFSTRTFSDLEAFPDDFFVGIGDINSNFLPKIDPSTLASTPVAPTTPPSTSNGPQASESTSNPEAVNGDTAGDSALLNESNAALDAQLEERPLAKKEKELQEHEEEEEEETEQTQIPDNATASAPPSESNAHEHHHHRKALLKNDDTELQRVGKVSLRPPFRKLSLMIFSFSAPR